MSETDRLDDELWAWTNRIRDRYDQLERQAAAYDAARVKLDEERIRFQESSVILQKQSAAGFLSRREYVAMVILGGVVTHQISKEALEPEYVIRRVFEIADTFLAISAKTEVKP